MKPKRIGNAGKHYQYDWFLGAGRNFSPKSPKNKVSGGGKDDYRLAHNHSLRQSSFDLKLSITQSVYCLVYYLSGLRIV